MNHSFVDLVPAWGRSLVEDVDRAFLTSSVETPPWPDPHPDRQPLEEEYSRCLDPGKYAIVGARLDAWVIALAAAGLALARTRPPSSWVGGLGGDGLTPRLSEEVRLVSPRPGTLRLVAGRTLVDGAPFGLDLGVAGEDGPTALLETVPDCGCDACDSGSDDLVEQLDRCVLAVALGGLIHARKGDQHWTRLLDLGSTTMSLAWGEAPDLGRGWQRWHGEPWRD